LEQEEQQPEQYEEQQQEEEQQPYEEPPLLDTLPQPQLNPAKQNQRSPNAATGSGSAVGGNRRSQQSSQSADVWQSDLMNLSDISAASSTTANRPTTSLTMAQLQSNAPFPSVSAISIADDSLQNTFARGGAKRDNNRLLGQVNNATNTQQAGGARGGGSPLTMSGYSSASTAAPRRPKPAPAASADIFFQ